MPMRTIPVGALAANCHLLWEDPAAALVVDPGAEGGRLEAALRAEGLTPALVVTTHGHFDHTGAVGHLVDAFGASFVHHRDETPIIRMTPPGTRIWGLAVEAVPEPAGYVSDGQRLDVGGLDVEVLHTPGHTPGSVCLHVPSERALLTGDTLFQRSVGRSDLPGGDGGRLADSIRSKLYTLPEDTVVHPGHGPTTTVGDERRENPFVRP